MTKGCQNVRVAILVIGCQDFVVQRLERIEGVKVTNPDGAFYILPDVSAFFGPSQEAQEFGAVPDADSLCRYTFMQGLEVDGFLTSCLMKWCQK